MMTTPYTNLKALASIRLFDVLGITGSEEEETAASSVMTNVVWDKYLTTQIMDELPEEVADELEDALNSDELENMPDAERPQKLAAILKQYIPTLENDLTTEALNTKAEMFFDRIEGLAQFHAKNTELLAKVDKARTLALEGKWAEAVTLLNSFTLKA